jgi:hypothetical protein
MKLRTAIFVLGIVVGLSAGASEAQAAKGVKKNGKGGNHVHHGRVTHVDHKAGQFTILAMHGGKKKKKGAGVAAAGAPHPHNFSVAASTKFAVGSGKNRAPASFAALRVGESVSVMSQKGVAEGVLIHKHKAGGKRPNKKPK